MEEGKQRGNTILTKQNADGQDYIRIDYEGNQAIAMLLAQGADMKTDESGYAYMPVSTFKLPISYDYYSPNKYIDYSRLYVRHPKTKREYLLATDYLERLEQKRYSLSTIQAYKFYFNDFMEYHKGRGKKVWKYHYTDRKRRDKMLVIDGNSGKILKKKDVFVTY